MYENATQKLSISFAIGKEQEKLYRNNQIDPF